MRKQLHFLLTIMLSISVSMYSQEPENDTISTDVIQVVKPYTPTISEAFKVKELPSLDDETTLTKKKVEYNILSFPVASTFTPAKGRAADVSKDEPEKTFDNYATLGAGMYTNVVGEVYLNHAMNRTESVSGYVSHHSSQGGISGLLLDDDFSNTKININYANNDKDLAWDVFAGFLHQFYQWYGIPQPLFDQDDANNLGDVGHDYFGFHLGGDIAFEETAIETGSLLFRRFGDNLGSGENRFEASMSFNIPLNDQFIHTVVDFDYLGGSFDRSYDDPLEFKYSNFNIGISPTYRLTQDDLVVDLGVSLYYLNDSERSDNKFFIYPNITASYRLVSDVLIAYGEIKGGLVQNSYFDFSQSNPFVSPTLNMTPTDRQYDFVIGLKGKLSNSMSYDLKGKYIAERDKPLFINNPVTRSSEVYTYGNSFGVIYDDVSTFSVSGEITADVYRNFSLGLKAAYFAYGMDKLDQAWNLPDFNASLFMDYQIDEHWFAGVNLFFVGERKDQFFVPSLITPTSPMTVTLKSYFDANAHVGYHLNDRWSAYLRLNNIANQDYERWQNYPVQGFQMLAGATYKFDF